MSKLHSIKLLCISFFLACLGLCSSLKAETYYTAFLVSSEGQNLFPVRAEGYALFTLSPDRTTIHYAISVWSLSGPILSADIRVGARRTDGPSVKTILFTDDRASSGLWNISDIAEPLTAALVDSLRAGHLYLNISTASNPNGELRGQIFLPKTFYSDANPYQEVPPLNSVSAFAKAFFIEDQQNQTLLGRGFTQTEGHAFGSSLNIGDITTNGPISKELSIYIAAPDSNRGLLYGLWTSDDPIPFNTAMSDLDKENVYWNVYTDRHAHGEVRGQLTRHYPNASDTSMWFIAMLSGRAADISFNSSAGTGTAFIQVKPNGKALVLDVYSANLSGPVTDAHIHFGEVGSPASSGSTIVSLPGPQRNHLVWTDTSTSGHPLTQADLANLFEGKLYIDLHTAQFPDGEIRGQIFPISQPSAGLFASSVAPAFVSSNLLQSYPNPFNRNTTVSYNLTKPGKIRIDVVSSFGEQIATLADDLESAGTHSVEWNAKGHASGVYFIELRTEEGIRLIRTTLSK